MEMTGTVSVGLPDDPNAAEVVKINSGQLYLIRPGNIRSSRECMYVSFDHQSTSTPNDPLSSYNEAMATIRRIPSVEHNFQLVITRVFEDGDQELIEDEAESARLVSSAYPQLTHVSTQRTKNARFL